MFRNIFSLRQPGVKFPNILHMNKNVHFSHNYSLTKDAEKIIRQPFNYLHEFRENDIDIQLLKAYNYWFKIPPETFSQVKEIVHLTLHPFIVLDDITDGSQIRDNLPVSHYVFGEASTINSACLAYFEALEKALKLGKERAMFICLENLSEMHKGHNIEMFWAENLICPSEEEYKAMVTKRTTSMMNIGLKLLQCLTDNQTDFTQLLKILGWIRQIYDDYIDIIQAKEKDCMIRCDDISEGKYSFPIIHSINRNLEDSTLIHILKRKPKEREIKNYVIQILEKNGSLEYTRKTLKGLYHEFMMENDIVGRNEELILLLEDIKNIE